MVMYGRGPGSSGWVTVMLGLILTGCTAAVAREQVTLVAGTLVEAKLRDSLASRGKDAAENLTATVTDDVTNGRGEVVIPAGSMVALRVAHYGIVARQADRRSPLNVTSVTVRGRVYPVSASAEPVSTPGRTSEDYRARPGVVVIRGTRILFSLPQSLTVPTR